MIKEEFLNTDNTELLNQILNGKYDVEFNELCRYQNSLDNYRAAQITFDNVRIEIVWRKPLIRRWYEFTKSFPQTTYVSVFKFDKSRNFWLYHRSQRRGFTDKKLNKTILGYLTEMKKHV